MNSNENIRALMILEIIGRPAEHIITSLNEIIEQIKTEKGVKVIQREVKPAVEMKEEKNIYTTFAEVEVEVEHPMHLALLVFKYIFNF